jgi:hypothetical protein
VAVTSYCRQDIETAFGSEKKKKTKTNPLPPEVQPMFKKQNQ